MLDGGWGGIRVWEREKEREIESEQSIKRDSSNKTSFAMKNCLEGVSLNRDLS